MGLVCVLLLDAARAACPVNDESGLRCSGQGSCNSFNQCVCDPGFDGADCGRKQCPKGPAWSYEKLDFLECSGRGLCTLGVCACHPSFTGNNCERVACQADCTKRGRCVSMESYYREMGSFLPYTAWDKNVLQGCRCETPHNGLGPTGFDCAFSACPKGDDPLTTGQVNEVQLLLCNANTGHFSLRFPSIHQSVGIPWDASAEFLKNAIQGLGIREVKITMTAGATRVCHDSFENVIQVEFMQDFGPVEPLLVDISELPDDGQTDVKVAVNGIPLGVVASQRGTKENKECAGRGLCDPLVGECLCYIVPMPGYRSSDGYGNPGERGDCGAADDHKFLGNVNGGPINCPGEIPCSGHGVCAGAPSQRCMCSDGWTSGDCSLRACPKGWPWFPTDYFSVKTIGALKKREKPPMTECSNKGTCDPAKGECTCQLGFSGAACQIMEICPSAVPAPCNGHGYCESARQQFIDAGLREADYLAQWEEGANINSHHAWVRYRYGEFLHTCRCQEGYGGYDCSQVLCPSGDDPDHPGEREVQLLECKGTSGSFSLTYGLETTQEISVSATAADIKARLEALHAVGTVEVEFSSPSSTACHNAANGTNVVRVTFNDYYYHYKAPAGSPSTLYGKSASLPTLLAHTNGTAPLEVPGTDTGTTTNGTVTVAAKGAPLYPAEWASPVNLANDSVALSGVFGPAQIARIPGVFGAGYYTVIRGDQTWPVTPWWLSQAGTRIHVECSGRGTCDYTTGRCLCFPGYASSDGLGKRGRIPDCGHVAQFQQSF
eukprot:g2943.t1